MYSRGLHEIVLIVKDVRRAAAFYQDVVGLIPLHPPTDEWASFATISPDNPQWLGLHKGKLLYEEHSPRPEGKRFGPVHYALRAAGSSESDFLENARSRGVAVYGPQNWEEDSSMRGRSYYFYDPDDNLVEYWFPHPSLEKSG